MALALDQIYELSIRRMTEDDVPFFNRVRNLSRQYLHDPTEFTVEQSIDWFTSKKPEFYILSHRGDMIGYFRTSDRKSDEIMIGMDIHPMYQSRGLAVPAYRLFMKYLNMEGIATFRLDVLSSNERAVNLYNKLGFEEVSRVSLPSRGCSNISMLYAYNESDDVFDDLRYIGSQLSHDDLLEFQNTYVMITGVNGFIGRWLIMIFDHLNKKYDLNINVYAHDISDRMDIKSEYCTYEKLDITDAHKIERLYRGRRVDYIFNCAGIANPSAYMRKPIMTLDVSYDGTKNILDLSMVNRAKSVVCFSSSEIYGTPETKHIPTPETHIGRINTRGNRSCYDVGKLVLETLCHVYHDQYKTPVKTIRPFNLYGPFMDDTRVIPNFMRKVIWEEPLHIYGDGTQTRTFCYVTDAVVMLLKLALYGEDGAVYNIGNDSPEITMPDLVQHISHTLGKDIEFKLVRYPHDYPDDEPMRRCPNISEMQNCIGYTPRIPLEVGLKNTFDYFKKKMK